MGIVKTRNSVLLMPSYQTIGLSKNEPVKSPLLIKKNGMIKAYVKYIQDKLIRKIIKKIRKIAVDRKVIEVYKRGRCILPKTNNIMIAKRLIFLWTLEGFLNFIRCEMA